jgi:heptose III glucuronosyltransferase
LNPLSEPPGTGIVNGPESASWTRRFSKCCFFLLLDPEVQAFGLLSGPIAKHMDCCEPVTALCLNMKKITRALLINLSIVIPVYKVEQYLPQCLDSVFSQNLKNCEVICVNDGTPDNSRVILADYQKNYPDLVIIDRENGGLPAARNSGLHIARGKYIYFLDSDDFLYPDVLTIMQRFAFDHDLDIACFNVLKNGVLPYFDIKTELPIPLTGIDYYKKNYDLNNFFPPSPVWMMLFKLKFLRINTLSFKENIEHEDEEFSPRAFFYAERVGCLNIST